MVSVLVNGYGEPYSNPGQGLNAFHIVPSHLGKAWFQLFSLQQWLNSKADRVFNIAMATSLGEGKLWIQDFVSHPAFAEVLGKYE